MPSSYKATIGLEIHAELKTKSKMFCGCKNDPDEKRPNVNICPVCMAHPGALPVINKEAVKHVIKIGLSLGGDVSSFTEFDRKNYFYPDIPKGYQISQYKYPLVSGGSLNGVKITRVHLEEDTARSSHDRGDYSLIDFNRAGISLMELVTEPVIASASDAGAFARELQLLLRSLGAGDANMEKGEMRVEANISVLKDTKVRPSLYNEGRTFVGGGLGTKVEVKNINSFRAVEKAIGYEVKRQIETLEAGGKVVQETRGWDEDKEETFSQRLKESSHDYRYFPDPDLPKLDIGEIPEFSKEALSKELPELPWEKRARYEKSGIKKEDADMYVRDAVFGRYIDKVLEIFNDDKESIAIASNFVSTDIAGLHKSGIPVVSELTPEGFAEIIRMYINKEISSRGAKDIISIAGKEGGSPKEIADSRGLLQKSDEEWLISIAKKVMENNKNAVSEYRAGKESSLKFLVGQGMKESGGSANPQILSAVFEKLLKN